MKFSLEVKLFHSLLLLLQLRENIAQDQEKSDASKSQMEQLKAQIQGIENEIRHMKTVKERIGENNGLSSSKP